MPAAVTALGGAVGAATVVIAGHPHADVAVTAVAVAPLLTLCAAMSARRGGRVPQSLLATAPAADPTGGGAAIAGWLAWWPSVAVITIASALALADSGAPAATALWTVTAAAVLTWTASRDLASEPSP